MKRNLFNFVKSLGFIGVLLATYLLWEQMHITSSAPLCTINSVVNCDAVISGPVSKTLGIPTPLIGLIGYILILVGAFKKNSKLVLGMVSFGLAFCLYIGVREIFELRVVCPVCILCLIDMIIIFIMAILLNQKNNQLNSDSNTPLMK